MNFKSIISGSNKLSLISNTNDITLDVVESNLSINNISGILNVSKGGTGVNTLTTGNFLIGNGTSPVTTTKVAPIGTVLGTSDAQILTNKTMTSATNNLIARALWIGSGSGSVSTYAAVAPNFWFSGDMANTSNYYYRT